MCISKARQLLGVLNFCLLSRAESEMERIDLLSTGGALPWARPLRSFARLPCRGLSFLFRPSTHTHTHADSRARSLTLSLSAWRLPLLQLTLVLPLQGETCTELLTLGLIFLLFLPISSVSCCWSLEETKDGGGEGMRLKRGLGSGAKRRTLSTHITSSCQQCLVWQKK